MPGVTVVEWSGLPLIMHMVRAASLSAGSKLSACEGGRNRVLQAGAQITQHKHRAIS